MKTENKTSKTTKPAIAVEPVLATDYKYIGKYVELGGEKFYYLNDFGTLPQSYFSKRFEMGLSNCPAASRGAYKLKQKEKEERTVEIVKMISFLLKIFLFIFLLYSLKHR